MGRGWLLRGNCDGPIPPPIAPVVLGRDDIERRDWEDVGVSMKTALAVEPQLGLYLSHYWA